MHVLNLALRSPFYASYPGLHPTLLVLITARLLFLVQGHGKANDLPRAVLLQTAASRGSEDVNPYHGKGLERRATGALNQSFFHGAVELDVG